MLKIIMCDSPFPIMFKSKVINKVILNQNDNNHKLL